MKTGKAAEPGGFRVVGRITSDAEDRASRIVAALEEALEDARSEAFADLVLVMRTADGRVFETFFSPDVTGLVGYLEFLKFKICADVNGVEL